MMRLRELNYFRYYKRLGVLTKMVCHRPLGKVRSQRTAEEAQGCCQGISPLAHQQALQLPFLAAAYVLPTTLVWPHRCTPRRHDAHMPSPLLAVQTRGKLVRVQRVVLLERLVYPGAGREIVHIVVWLVPRSCLIPKHCSTHFGDRVAALLHVRDHASQRNPRIDQIVDEQHFPVQCVTGRRDALGDSELALLCTRCRAIATHRQDREWHGVDTRDHVTNPQPTTRQTEERVKPIARCMDLQCKLLDQPVILVPRNVQIFHLYVLQATGGDNAHCALVLPVLPEYCPRG